MGKNATKYWKTNVKYVSILLFVSKFTKPTPEHIKLLVEKNRIPSGVDEVNNNH
jgi:hypothetical protein